ncbi:aerotolerance regulator BatD [Leptospira borgpetersenii]|uniref:Oxygen tolerance protein n=2 Tax=Leptospira borgpetersenii TaxID=174 RepID=A0A0E3B3H0_LEPBO|nr:BatD family protein [Leptospira borgpetersenii]AXX17576.1 aerotolerance regulator BatD [Leptospira borgpetersenii serovar Ceylonica]EKQ91471.1 oxygen tolerance protein [Leptospira borgpetersenii str. UI 09149]EKR01206.1 oxygen tolerance protein [Leptospira borgpetersenii serovar Castellonis str. 200801910]EMK13539.1 oxygen tolerance protein [Leptospira sp. serovar Kenya str. Sh9]EMN58742.1 oxygen tolerance protein [Leptospira borgpetersenii serovar Javanica str. MK146]EMO11481.1 oxygen tol
MVKRFWVLPFLFWVGSLAAEETKFYVTRNTFHLGEESYAVFEMDMDSRASIPQNSFSNGDISVFYAGSEENTTIINFQVFRKRLLKFRIKASRQGVFTLPPVSIEVNGKKFVSDPLQIQVLERSKTVRRGGSFFDRFFRFEEEDLSENADLKVIFQTSKKEAWIGEPIIGYFTLYYRDVRKPYFDRNPADSIQFPYFRSEVLSGVAVKVPDQVLYEGNIYDIAVYNKEIYSLIPLRAGEFHLGKTTFSLEGQLQSYFDMKTVTTTPSRIRVKELPKFEGNFSGGVGEFKARVKIENDLNTIKTGDTLYLSVVIEGEGNLSSVTEPLAACKEEKNCSSEFTLYDTSKSWKFTELKTGGYGFYSVARFEYGIPMETVGVWRQEPMDFVYFNPDSGSYKTISLQIPSVNVAQAKKEFKGAESSSSNSEEGKIRILFFAFGFLSVVIVAIWFYVQKLDSTFFISLPILFPVFGVPILKELDLQMGSKRGFVLRQFLLSKGISETDVSFLMEIFGVGPGCSEFALRLNLKDKRTLLRIANRILKHIKEKDL